MALVKYNNNSISAVTSAAAIPSGAMTLIKTIEASSSSDVSFVHGSSDVVLDSTYPIYVFKFINIHPATDSVFLDVNFRDGDTNYDATKTTTSFAARHDEADSATSFEYTTSDDLAQSSSAVHITGLTGNGNDESTSGELFLFAPSSTTFVKHFISRVAGFHESDYAFDFFTAGYGNTTSAIDAVQFKFDSGTFDGVIKLYGIS